MVKRPKMGKIPHKVRKVLRKLRHPRKTFDV